MKINVITEFKLNLEEGFREFKAGIQEVEDFIASHWYVMAHSEIMGKAKATKAVSDDQAVDGKKAAADAAQKQADALLSSGK